MSDMKAFEIHTFQGGKWKIDSVFDDRELALYEAQRMDESGRYTGVRVVEEVFVETTQQTKTRTIYRGTKVEETNAAELRKASQVRNRAAQSRAKRQHQVAVRKTQARREQIRRKSSPVRLIFIMVMLLALAGGALYALQHIQNNF